MTIFVPVLSNEKPRGPEVIHWIGLETGYLVVFLKITRENGKRQSESTEIKMGEVILISVT